MKTSVQVTKETRNGLMKIKYERDLIDINGVIEYLMKKKEKEEEEIENEHTC